MTRQPDTKPANIDYPRYLIDIDGSPTVTSGGDLTTDSASELKFFFFAEQPTSFRQ